VRPISKITGTKSTGGVAQVVECPPSSCEALSSTLHAIKKKKTKKTILALILANFVIFGY
jgi:hypothetical protein